jgi:hypothetical protein
MGFASFMASTAGRAIRIVAGIALILVGIFALDGALRIILPVVGLVPLAAGLFDFCVFAPLFGAPFKGDDIRQNA